MRIRHYFILLSMIFVLVSYQNCGEVSLQSPKPVLPSITFNGLSGKFCSSFSSTHRYNIEKFMIINLTSRVIVSNSFTGGVQGVIGLYPDSDMDGLVDAEEVSQGFDPLNARTNGTLDSLCRDEGNCGPCNDTTLSGIGLYRCESPSFDSDNDGIIDFVEIIRGTDRIRIDDQLDDDNDLISNYEEIRTGRSPIHFQDHSLSDRQKLDYIYTPSAEASQDCPSINAIQRQTMYDFQVNNIALVDTQEYTDPTLGPFNLSHEAGENVILILFVSAPLDPAQPKEYYARVLKVASNIEGLNIYLNPVDFEKLQ